MTRVVLVLAVMVLVACGSSTDGSSIPGGGSSGPPCTLTVSGGTAGRFACTTRSASWSDTTDLASVMMGYGTVGQTDPVIGVAFTFEGLLQAGTFVDADGGITARITVKSAGASWAATDGPTAPTTGTYTLVLTSVTSTKILADGEIDTVNGTLDATLPRFRGRRRPATSRCRRHSDRASTPRRRGRCRQT